MVRDNNVLSKCVAVNDEDLAPCVIASKHAHSSLIGMRGEILLTIVALTFYRQCPCAAHALNLTNFNCSSPMMGWMYLVHKNVVRY